MSGKKTLYLVDGSSYLFRAYYALPPLTTSKGLSTGAAYGVINMLKKFIKDYDIKYIAVIFDTKGKNFRHDKLPEYKANRAAMPDDLQEQIEPLHNLIKNMGLELIKLQGVEADDIIATLTKQAVNQNWDVVISTLDKDIAQLVNDNVKLVNTMTGEVLDREGVVNKFSIEPEQVIDYLSLIGDSSDNIPGIPKVGPKTAVKWLSEYKNIENIIANKDKFTGKVGENLRENIDKLSLNQELIKLKDDVKLEKKIESLDSLEKKEINHKELLEQCKEYEFRTWIKDLENSKELNNAKSSTQEDIESNQQVEYKLINTQKDFDKLINKLDKANYFAFDTETTSLNPIEAELVGISISLDSEKNISYYIPVGHNYENVSEQLEIEDVLTKLSKIFSNKNISKIAHNFKYDFAVLKKYFEKYNIELNNFNDTMLESYVVDSTSGKHNLDALAKRLFNLDLISYEDVAGKGKKQINFSEVEIDKALDYAAEDALICKKLHEKFHGELEANEKLYKVYKEIELPLVKVLQEIEEYGVLIDIEKLKQQSLYLQDKIDKLKKEAFEIVGEQFNLDSPKQLQEIFFNKLELPVLQKTPKGQPSTAENVLTELALDYRLPKIVLEYRSFNKLKTTYTDKLPEVVDSKTNRMHTSYHQAGTSTGRLSSSDPNLQNIPVKTEEGRKIRNAFIAPNRYKIMSCDYSQVELRIMAHLSNDPGLFKAFKNNEDVHKSTAAEIFGVSLDEVTKEQRRYAKAINFGLIYGMSAFGLAKQLGIGRNEAQVYIDRYFEKYPNVLTYMEETRKLAAKQGYVETVFGRRLYLRDINSKNVMVKKAQERIAINAPMQGTAADIIKLAMIEVNKNLKDKNLDARIIMQVHDELVFEVNENILDEVQKLVVKSMVDAGSKLDVSLLVDTGIGDNWGDAH